MGENVKEPRPPKRSIRDRVLAALWSKAENDVRFYYPSAPDGHWLYGWFAHARLSPSVLDGYDIREKGWPYDAPSFLDELKSRGYDVKTLKFTVEKDPNHPRWAKP